MSIFTRFKEYQYDGLQIRMLWLGDKGEHGHNRFNHYGYERYVRVGDVVEVDYVLPDYGKLLIRETDDRRSFVIYAMDEGIIWEVAQ